MNISSAMKATRSELFDRRQPRAWSMTSPMDNIQDGNQLYVMLQKWLQSFQEDPAKNAVPDTVTLAPIAIANGPVPPNAADIQHAQDVLMLCAKQRSQILDGLNLMSYIAQNPSRYEFPPPTTRAEVVNALNGYQSDLDLVAAAASAAINDVSAAVAPAEFAGRIGKTYPGGLPPVPMPILQKGLTDSLAAKGEMLTAQDPLAAALRDQQPEGDMRRGFLIGMAAAERQTAPVLARTPRGLLLLLEQRGGFQIAVTFSLMRNRAIQQAEQGAAVAAADPDVAAAAHSNNSVFYRLGFDVGTGIYGDPSLGRTATPRRVPAPSRSATRSAMPTRSEDSTMPSASTWGPLCDRPAPA